MPDSDDRDRCAGRNPVWLAADIVEDAGDWSAIDDAVALVDGASIALAAHPVFANMPPCQVCIALSDDDCVRALNAGFRDKDTATNVLSFPSAEPPTTGAPRNLGDVIIALETVQREALDQGISAAHHLQHLAVHGLLHLLGYDHDTGAAAEAMEALEVEILAALNVPDPYEGTELDDPHEPTDEGRRRVQVSVAAKP